MPIYEFFCKPCNAVDEVVRPISESNNEYICPECGEKTVKKYSPPQVITQGEQIPYLHPAFGTIMTDRQAKDEAKRRGWVEIGNENQDRHLPPPPRKSYEASDYFL